MSSNKRKILKSPVPTHDPGQHQIGRECGHGLDSLILPCVAHFVPFSKGGGGTTLENLQPLREPYKLKKGNREDF
jgi:hypothetical protein